MRRASITLALLIVSCEYTQQTRVNRTNVPVFVYEGSAVCHRVMLDRASAVVPPGVIGVIPAGTRVDSSWETYSGSGACLRIAFGGRTGFVVYGPTLDHPP